MTTAEKVMTALSIFVLCVLFRSCSIELIESEPVIHEYELLSIYPYTDTRTNDRGGVISQDLKYVVIFTDGKNVYQTDTFCPENGDVFYLSEDGNKYKVAKYAGAIYEAVFLSKEMFTSLGLQR